MDKIDEALAGSKVRDVRIFHIEKTLREVNQKKLLLDEEKFAFDIAEEYGVSKGKAIEYIKQAKRRISDWMGKKWKEPTDNERITDKKDG